MVDLARLPAEIEKLRRRPDLTEHEMGLLNCICPLIERTADQSRPLAERVEGYTTLYEVMFKVRIVADRFRKQDEAVCCPAGRATVGRSLERRMAA